jgi:hypothetical protein
MPAAGGSTIRKSLETAIIYRARTFKTAPAVTLGCAA